MSQETQTLDQALTKTDFGKMINDNKKIVLGLAIALIIAAFGANFYMANLKADKLEDLNSLYQFRAEKFEPFEEGKISYEQFEKDLNAVRKDLLASPTALSLVSDVSDVLIEKKHTDKSIEILENLRKNLDQTKLGFQIISFRLISLYEDKANYSQAVSLLEELLKSGQKENLTKVYFDLGRNYYYLDKKTDAKKNFEYVVANDKESKFAKMSKLYLEKL